jgi:NADH-quinone oxidoreductase subunit N
VSFMSNDFQVLFPELLLAIGGMALLILGVMRGDRALGLVSWLAVILLVVAGWYVLFP